MDWNQLFSSMEAECDPQKARDMSLYMREKFVFLGIKTPQRRKICAPFFRTAKKGGEIDWEFISLCWNKKEREYQYLAVDYLRLMEQFLDYGDLGRIKKLILTKSWWDTVDSLSGIVGRLALRYPELSRIMLEWSDAKNIWIRRTAIIHQLQRQEKTDAVLLEAILANNLKQSEFFINKAFGWALRDYSKTNPDWVRAFINKHRQKMSALSIREGSKYLG